ncbi:hypothetical protein F4826_004892 [Rahnella inusitata]|nr:hypothetical protein [Rahnella inusitata]
MYLRFSTIVAAFAICCGFKAYTGVQRLPASGPLVGKGCVEGTSIQCIVIPMDTNFITDDQSGPDLPKTLWTKLVLVRPDGHYMDDTGAHNGNGSCIAQISGQDLSNPNKNVSPPQYCLIRKSIASTSTGPIGQLSDWVGTRLCTVVYSVPSEFLYSAPKGCVPTIEPPKPPTGCSIRSSAVLFDHGVMNFGEEGFREEQLEISCDGDASASLKFSPPRVVLSDGSVSNLSVVDGEHINLLKGENQIQLNSRIVTQDGGQGAQNASGSSIVSLTLD